MLEAVCVDTNIWEYAYVKEADLTGGDELHREARDFIRDLLADAGRSIVVSQYQLVVILDVLRKVGVRVERRDMLYELLNSPPKCRVVPVTNELVKEAFDLSKESGIHIYDYLVALPVRDVASVIHSADRHFQHQHFQAIARIENPLSWAVTEGQRPQRVPL